jgi:hypothetical protein
MAYLKTSDSIVIQATLTDKGKKLLSRGNFKIAKFALGDDEIDYSLFRAADKDDEGFEPALLNSEMFEAYKPTHSNIQYGLDSFDSAILYLTSLQQDTILEHGDKLHANILYLPILKTNSKLTISPSLSSSVYYLSVNDETTQKLDSINDFRFLTTNRLENVKFVVESGMDIPPGITIEPTRRNRREYILEKYLLDVDYFLYADNRLITKVCGIQQSSEFKNFPSAEVNINFVTDRESPPVSYASEFDNYATYITKGIPTHAYAFPEMTAVWGPDDGFANSSSFGGPRGSIVAFNPLINEELKGTSTSTRDFRYSDFGTTEQIVFSELPTSKFDYIDTTIYIIGATTNARLQIPVRLIRYVGT